MTTYIIRRLLMGVLIVFLVATIVFFAIRLLPGDPILIIVAQSATIGMTMEELEELRRYHGLDRPLPVQYLNWLGNLLQGDFGRSIHYREHVFTLLMERFPITLYLGLLAFTISTVFGITFGLIAALRRGTWIDTTVTMLSNLGVTIPVFWLGALLIYVFSIRLGWLPIAGFTLPWENFWLSIRQSLMPALCLSVGSLAVITRQTRSSVLEVAQQDYVRTAWAKGLREKVVISRHILKNSLIPVITMLGMFVGMIIGGSVLIETIFAIPGVGRLLVGSVFAQDFVVVQSGVLIIATAIVFINMIVDISYGWIDPRVRYE